MRLFRQKLFLGTSTFLLVTLSFTLYCFSEPLEDAYKEEHQRLTIEVLQQQQMIDVLSAYIQRESFLSDQDAQIRRRDRMHEGTRAGNLEARISVNNQILENNLQLVRSVSQIKGISEGEAGTINARRELQNCRDRKIALVDKIKELKLKVLEKLGKMPEWWTD
jgi:hypothetical protein